MIADASQPGLLRAAELLRTGECVALPTETVYGLAANATDAAACAKIFAAKERPANDPLIVHVLDAAQARTLCEWSAPAEKLAARFWPGPLTLVLHKGDLIPGIVTSGKPTVALRAPAHPVFREVLRLTQLPLAAPSANRFSRVSPTCASDVEADLGTRIPLIIDGGECAVGIESTIVSLTGATPTILRPGIITRAQLEEALSEKVVTHTAHAAAPGNFPIHYSPSTPLVLFKDTPPANTAARIFFHKPAAAPPDYSLSLDGSLESAAHRLYHLLHELDRCGYASAAIQEPPHAGLGAALNDRIRRACGRTPQP